MNIALIIPVADNWGMHDGGLGAGWWIVMAIIMVVFMGGMMWMMMRGMGHGSPPESSAPLDRFASNETPVEILERRFAEGAITVEDYRERRKVLVNGNEPNGAGKYEAVTATRPEGASR